MKSYYQFINDKSTILKVYVVVIKYENFYLINFKNENINLKKINLLIKYGNKNMIKLCK